VVIAMIITRSGHGLRPAVFIVQKTVGFVAVDEALGPGVPLEAFPGRHCDVRQVGEGGRAMSFLDVGDGPLSAFDVIKESDSGARPMPWVAMLLQYEARATVTFPSTPDRTSSAI